MKNMDSFIKTLEVIGSVLSTVVPLVVSVLLAYVAGAATSRREQRQKTYAEILPPIDEMVYNRRKADVPAYNRAMCRLWLYGRNDVMRDLDKPLHVIHGSREGNREEALKEIIIAFRRDVQWWRHWPSKPLTKADIHHLYTNPLKQEETAGRPAESDAGD